VLGDLAQVTRGTALQRDVRQKFDAISAVPRSLAWPKSLRSRHWPPRHERQQRVESGQSSTAASP